MDDSDKSEATEGYCSRAVQGCLDLIHRMSVRRARLVLASLVVSEVVTPRELMLADDICGESANEE